MASTLSFNRNGSIGTGSLTVVSYDGTVQLASALTHIGTFTLTQGTVDLNGQTLTSNAFSSSNTNTRELKDTAGGGKIIVNGLTGIIFDMSTTTGLTVSNAPDIDIGDSNNTLTADVTFAGGGKTFGDFKVTKHAGDFDCIITGANTFGIITEETPDATYQYSHLQLPGSVTITCTDLVSDGTASYQNNLQAASGTATLSCAAGSVDLTYTTITNMIAQGGATFNALTTNGNVDGGGNTGWIFSSGNRRRRQLICGMGRGT